MPTNEGAKVRERGNRKKKLRKVKPTKDEMDPAEADPPSLARSASPPQLTDSAPPSNRTMPSSVSISVSLKRVTDASDHSAAREAPLFPDGLATPPNELEALETDRRDVYAIPREPARPELARQSYELRSAPPSEVSSALSELQEVRRDFPVIEDVATDLQHVANLGTGTFGLVYLARHVATGRVVAIKKLNKAYVVQRKQTLRVNNERRFLMAIDSPFVITLYRTMQDDTHLYFLLEYVPGGELFSRIRQSRFLAPAVARFYAAEVVLAIDAMHRLNIVYRDLKPENVLIDRHGHVRLCDLGFALRIKHKSFSICGTPEYMAPEMILGRGAGFGADWWAVGVLLYEMLVGRPPFRHRQKIELYRLILKAELRFPFGVPDDAQECIRSLLTVDASERLGCQRGGVMDICEHPFFAEIDWDALRNMEDDGPWVPNMDDDLDTSAFDLTGQTFVDNNSQLPESQQHLFVGF